MAEKERNGLLKQDGHHVLRHLARQTFQEQHWPRFLARSDGRRACCRDCRSRSRGRCGFFVRVFFHSRVCACMDWNSTNDGGG